MRGCTYRRSVDLGGTSERHVQKRPPDRSAFEAAFDSNEGDLRREDSLAWAVLEWAQATYSDDQWGDPLTANRCTGTVASFATCVGCRLETGPPQSDNRQQWHAPATKPSRSRPRGGAPFQPDAPCKATCSPPHCRSPRRQAHRRHELRLQW
eukprot:Polyplicarium_translucidae@DN2766_c0_g1_i4.p1